MSQILVKHFRPYPKLHRDNCPGLLWVTRSIMETWAMFRERPQLIYDDNCLHLTSLLKSSFLVIAYLPLDYLITFSSSVDWRASSSSTKEHDFEACLCQTCIFFFFYPLHCSRFSQNTSYQQTTCDTFNIPSLPRESGCVVLGKALHFSKPKLLHFGSKPCSTPTQQGFLWRST